MFEIQSVLPVEET